MFVDFVFHYNVLVVFTIWVHILVVCLAHRILEIVANLLLLLLL